MIVFWLVGLMRLVSDMMFLWVLWFEIGGSVVLVFIKLVSGLNFFVGWVFRGVMKEMSW